MFTFNDRHCSEFGIIWKTTSRPIMPAIKNVSENFIERDGTTDFSTNNADNREHYEDRVFSGTITIKNTDSITELQRKLSRIAEWLMCGWSELIFDDMPTTVWRARASTDNVMYLLEKYGQASLSFRCEPFSKLKQLNLGSDELLGSDILLGVNSISEYKITKFDFGDFEGYIDLNGQIPTWYSKPIITVFGSLEEFSINGVIINNRQSPDGEFVIDFENRIVKRNGENILEVVNGNFNEIVPGQDKIFFSGKTLITSLVPGFLTINCVPNSNYIYEAVGSE